MNRLLLVLCLLLCQVGVASSQSLEALSSGGPTLTVDSACQAARDMLNDVYLRYYEAQRQCAYWEEQHRIEREACGPATDACFEAWHWYQQCQLERPRRDCTIERETKDRLCAIEKELCAPAEDARQRAAMYCGLEDQLYEILLLLEDYLAKYCRVHD